jgi:glycosyltransferase involved in cell wall biosynthesis
VGTAGSSGDAAHSRGMLVVALLTRGSPHQLTGGHLYHRRMADAARGRDARVDILSVSARRDPFRHPFREVADVVLIDSLAAAAIAPWVLAGRHRGRPLAAIVHQQPGGVGHGAIRTAAQRRLDTLLYRRCDLLIAASASVADHLGEHCGVLPERICVAPPGRDLPTTAPAACDLRAGRRIAVLCVGNWFANKGIAELVDAVASLPADAVTLHLVGRTDVDGRYRDQMLARLATPELAGRVIVHGAVEPGELAGLYAGADVFALPSYAEAYGTVYAEALTAGLPVVGWSSGNLPNLIDDRIEGCLVDTGDVGGLSAALDRLATDDAWRVTLAAAARRRSEALPTWGDTADAFYGALSRLAPARD